MHFNGFPAATSTFLSETMEECLNRVLNEHQIDPVAQTRLSSLQHSLPVKGRDKIAAWRRRADQYPTGLMTAMLSEYLKFSQLRNATMYLERNDLVPLYRGLAEVGENLTRSLLSLNRLYLPTPDRLKWIERIADELNLKPLEFGSRLNSTYRSSPMEGIEEMRRLSWESLDLVEANVPEFDLRQIRRHLEELRQPWREAPS